MDRQPAYIVAERHTATMSAVHPQARRLQHDDLVYFHAVQQGRKRPVASDFFLYDYVDTYISPHRHLSILDIMDCLQQHDEVALGVAGTASDDVVGRHHGFKRVEKVDRCRDYVSVAVEEHAPFP